MINVPPPKLPQDGTIISMDAGATANAAYDKLSSSSSSNFKQLRSKQSQPQLQLQQQHQQQQYQQQQQQQQQQQRRLVDHVGMTAEAAEHRSMHIHQTLKKPLMTSTTSSSGNSISSSQNSSNNNNNHPKKTKDISSLLFPGMEPEEFLIDKDLLTIYVDTVDSRLTSVGVPFDYYRLPVCKTMDNDRIVRTGTTATTGAEKTTTTIKTIKKRNLGQRLMGYSSQTTPYQFYAMQNIPCQIVCQTTLDGKDLKFVKRLIEQKYRINFNLDGLPILMRSSELDYAIRGFPIGFVDDSTVVAAAAATTVTDDDDANPNKNDKNNGKEKKNTEIYLYNHLRFQIYYNNDNTNDDDSKRDNNNDDNNLIRITGFDVVPVSVDHTDLQSACTPSSSSTNSNNNTSYTSSTILNNPSKYLHLSTGPAGSPLSVIYTYEVKWTLSSIKWNDRWDVYLFLDDYNSNHGKGSMIHRYFSIINSFMVTLLLSGTVAIIMVRILKKDIASMGTAGDSSDLMIMNVNASGTISNNNNTTTREESGWKLLHGDVFRGPTIFKSILCALVGTGCQIGVSVLAALLCALLRLCNNMLKGQTLTTVLMLYVLNGFLAGYISVWLRCQFGNTNTTAATTNTRRRTTSNNSDTTKTTTSPMNIPWKRVAFFTASTFPALVVFLFLLLNFFLKFRGAATAVPALTIVQVFGLWICVSTPLVFMGGFLGYCRHHSSNGGGGSGNGNGGNVLMVNNSSSINRNNNNRNSKSSKSSSVASSALSLLSPPPPRKTNNIERFIPPYNTKYFFLQYPYIPLLCGILPFGSVCIELYFLMGALWQHQIYYIMGFVLVVCLILASTCVSVSIVATYIQLCHENHKWWWTSFLNTASTGLYLFGYSIWYLVSKLELVGVLPVLVYVTYMGMISVALGLYCGSIGVLSSFWFCRMIYGALKAD